MQVYTGSVKLVIVLAKLSQHNQCRVLCEMLTWLFVCRTGSQKLSANTVVHRILPGQDRPQVAQTPAEEVAQSIGSAQACEQH